jgi:uncharacterized protein (DUF427 family)
MTSKEVKIPGPDHPIAIEMNSNRVVVRFAGRTVADTRSALTLSEASYPPVQYIPMADVDTSMLSQSGRATYCPYKGDCSYFSIVSGDARADDAVWTYKEPYEAVSSIKDYVAFYPNRVEISQSA